MLICGWPRVGCENRKMKIDEIFSVKKLEVVMPQLQEAEIVKES